MVAYVIDMSENVSVWHLQDVHHYWTHDLYGPVVTADWLEPDTARVQRNTFPLDVISVSSA